MNFDWDQAKTFLTVADEGSLSGAARVLGQTQPTVSRQISALEKSLNVTLFERTGRSVTLTQFGVELLDHVRAMARGADMVSLSAMGQSQSVEGQIRITASELMSAFVLPPIVKKINLQAPLLELDIVADNGIRDLVRREADIAIRHARPEQPNLITKRVGDECMRFFASSNYIKEAGVPKKHNLSSHQIVSYVEADIMLSYLIPAGLELTRANFRFTSSSQFVALQLVLGGLGIAILPEKTAEKIPDLVPVVNDIDVFKLPTWLVTHSELKTTRRIRLVFDHLSDALT
ncbi:MAG: LysR family transcriptional regulator [Pseudomonadota bacterium]